MPVTKVQSPTGEIIPVEHPEGASDADILAYAQRQGGTTPTAAPSEAKPAPAPFKSVLDYVFPETYRLSDPRWKGQTAQRMIEAGSIAGAGSAAGLASKVGMRAIPAALTRIAGTAAGAELGGEAAGAKPGTGALQGGVGAIAGETLSPMLGKILRSVPGAKGRIASSQAATLGEQVSREVPPIPRATSSQSLRDVAYDPRKGLKPLQAEMGAALDTIEGHLGGELVNVPSLSPEPLSYRQAKRLITELGNKGWGGAKADPYNRSVAGLDARETYDQAIDELSGELRRIDPSGKASEVFEKARELYRKGMGYLKLLRTPRAFEGYPHEVQFNRQAIQRRYAQRQGELGKKIGPQGARELEQNLYGGGPVGIEDKPIAGSGHFLDAVRAFFGQTGPRPRLLALLPQTVAPNVAAQYVGKAPYTASPSLQVLLDILGGRAAGGANIAP